jgi:hypothetical protein
MRTNPCVWLSVAALLLSATVSSHAQSSGSIRYSRGQSIQPVFEGWEPNPDGTYSMWFGYLNRNWDDQLVIPVGAENKFEPGVPDRGQPTVFQTGADRRRQQFAFKVTVPADWPKDRDLIWTVTANGVAQKAVGTLWPVWMVDSNVVSANRGAMRDTDPNTTNRPPVVTSAPGRLTANVGTPLAIELNVTDDDMPKRRKPGELVAGGGVVVPDGGKPRVPAREGSRNAARDGATDSEPRMVDSLRVTWVQWRGDGVATFDPNISRVLGDDGKQTFTKGRTVTKVTFDKPGTYVLRPYAEDMSLFSIGPDITVAVSGASAAAKP